MPALTAALLRERQMLSCGPPEHESAVSAVLAERSALTRERKSLLEEVSKLHAERLAAQLDAQGVEHVLPYVISSRASASGLLNRRLDICWTQTVKDGTVCVDTCTGNKANTARVMADQRPFY